MAKINLYTSPLRSAKTNTRHLSRSLKKARLFCLNVRKSHLFLVIESWLICDRGIDKSLPLAAFYFDMRCLISDTLSNRDERWTSLCQWMHQQRSDVLCEAAWYFWHLLWAGKVWRHVLVQLRQQKCGCTLPIMQHRWNLWRPWIYCN